MSCRDLLSDFRDGNIGQSANPTLWSKVMSKMKLYKKNRLKGHKRVNGGFKRAISIFLPNQGHVFFELQS